MTVRLSSRRSGSTRRPRSKRESRHLLPDTDSDHGGLSSGRKSQQNSNSDSSYPCGCPPEMSHLGGPNGTNSATQDPTWSHVQQQPPPQQPTQHQGLPRSYPPTQVPFQRISHTKYPNGNVERDASPGVTRRPPCSGYRPTGVGAPCRYCPHQCQPPPPVPCPAALVGHHTCCHHPHHNTCTVSSSACGKPLQATTAKQQQQEEKIDEKEDEGQSGLLFFTCSLYSFGCMRTF